MFDRYDKEKSIKQVERERRGANQINPSHQVSGPHEVPNYRLFLKGTANKAVLAAFVSETLATKSPTRLRDDQSIVLAGGFTSGEIVKLVKKTGVTLLPQLFSTQEEADTRMALHAACPSQTHSRIVIRCDDTDVLVILLYFYSKGNLTTQVYMHAGHYGRFTTNERYIPVHAIAGMLGDNICSALPSMHALTGCDSTCALFRIGKRTAFTKLSQNIVQLGQLSQFGLSLSASACQQLARLFLLSLYGQKGNECSDLDELRYTLALTTDKEASTLPPTEDAFKQHVLRAMLQTRVWCQSDIPKPNIPGIVGHGWHLDENGCLKPTMHEQECAPIEVRDVTHLFCRDRSCTTSRNYPCLLAGLACIEHCSCTNCSNKPAEQSYERENSDTGLQI